ncbi:MAG: hexose kinase [Clostridia bacterium]|nr:hexose kinase [Clostridia bacterium]
MNVTTLTLCPAVDVHCKAQTFIAGRENNAVITDRDAGGKGVNLSRALNSLGLKNTAAVVLGADDEKEFSDCLIRDGVNAEKIVYPGKIRTNITVHAECETRLSFDGFSVDASLCERLAPVFRALEKGDFLTLTGRLPPGCPKKELSEAVSELVGRGVKLVLDSNSFSTEEVFALGPYLIKPNREELARYTAKEPESVEEAALAAECIRKNGVENVMVSLGPLGACLACREGVFFCAAPDEPPVSTIGAGDSSLAGFIFAEANFLPSPDRLRAAVASGSAACLQRGTRPPLKKDFDRIFAEAKTERIRDNKT